MTTTPAAPYKGLRYYRSEDAKIFAARERDAERCAMLLTGNASVLMLHGRTGCGKSSFLRAALKPFLDAHLTGLRFLENQQGFAVVRSGVTPLREIAIAVYELIEDEQKRETDPVVREQLGTVRLGLTKEEFVKRFASSPGRMADRVRALGKAAKRTPIIVVDQAEEIFTLTDRKGALMGGDSAEPELSSFELEDARADYMSFLRAAAGQSLGVKFLVSLRTEYKGMFEDELRRDMSVEAGSRLAGFHLDDLDEHGLIEAIVSPTKLLDDNNSSVFDFDYDDAVPLVIARRLLHRDAVPMGGVLPTMQVVCLRLYNETKRARSANRDSDRWKIRLTDLDRLGDLDNQVEIHLRERLEEMFLRVRSSKAATPATGPGSDIVEIDRTKDLDQWYRLLERLVGLQGDGRAVTRQLPESELRDLGHKFECRLIDDGALEYLASDDVGILRCETPEVTSATRKGTTFWTLGHDSLGLAIHKWAITYKELIIPTMRMDINSPRNAARLSQEQLFPDSDLSEDAAMPTFVIDVPTDQLWDHQIPFFAHTRRLSQRLGIVFVRQSDLALTPPPTASRVLVSAERAAFPPKADRGAWTDIAVSDLFQGNGLVGPMIEGLEPLRTVDAGDDKRNDKRTALDLARLLGNILDHLVNVGATILAYDESTKSMMKLASYLAGRQLDYAGALRYEKRVNTMSAREELFEQLVSHGHDPSVFMVGTAYGRALASHRGYITYFDCQDLSRFMDILDRLQSGREPAALAELEARLETRPESRSQLFRLYQEIFSHTVWQINIPASEWRRIEHYPLVMRLAALCYFTADYIRSFPDDFVRHVYDWHANNFQPTDRVSRETIRQILQDCFLFLSFDENPRLLFDPDNKFEFNPRDDGIKLSSTVAAVHAELTACRKRTVDLFGELCWQLEQLERHGKDSRGDDSLRRAEALRGFAWANFRIYNYYDSARLMEQALRLVSHVVAETTSQLWGEAARGISSIGAARNRPDAGDCR